MCDETNKASVNETVEDRTGPPLRDFIVYGIDWTWGNRADIRISDIIYVTMMKIFAI